MPVVYHGASCATLPPMAKLGPIAIKLFGYRIIFYQGADMPERGVLEIGAGLTATDVPPATSSDKGTTRIALDAGAVASLSGLLAQGIRYHSPSAVDHTSSASPVRRIVLARNLTTADLTIQAVGLYAEGTFTANDTNYWDLKLSIGDSAGTVTTAGAQELTTKTALSSGTGDWDPATPSKRRFFFGGPVIVVPSGSTLLLEIYKGGSPAADLPTFSLHATG